MQNAGASLRSIRYLGTLGISTTGRYRGVAFVSSAMLRKLTSI